MIDVRNVIDQLTKAGAEHREEVLAGIIEAYEAEDTKDNPVKLSFAEFIEVYDDSTNVRQYGKVSPTVLYTMAHQRGY